jgi:DNA helicase-2/ATP-dependent DNA helicase PcrA
MEHLKGLNSPQKEAAIHKNGPLLIIAGAGAGKTKTITHRIVNLIKTGVSPNKILAVTFTNKAAKEMKERVLKELEKNVKGQDTVPFISTFHSLGVHIIKENAQKLGLTKHFSILDDNDTSSLIKESMKELGLDPKEHDPRRIKNLISREKGKFKHLSDYSESSELNTNEPHLNLALKVWKIYEQKKNKENALDFDDLLVKSVKLLKEDKNILEYYQNKWEFIHIDEYQDTNEVQYLMSKLLAEKNKNICVVGDADQNIYSWRGANLKNILNFEKDYKNAKIITLEENYRSTKNILEAANEIIKKNIFRPEKNLFTKNEAGEKISLYEAISETDEADFVASKILEIIDSGKAEPGEIAILYRANFQSRVLEEAMLQNNIPYQVLGIKFFERKEIKDTLAYLRAALNPESLSDIKRIINFPARGIGKATIMKIFSGEKDKLPVNTKIKINKFYELLENLKENIVEKNKKASEIIKYVIKKTGIETELQDGTEESLERLENIKELATLALKYDDLSGETGIEKLLEDAALASDQDSILINENKKSKKEDKNAVKLMTVHAAKGLEFKSVFVVGLEDGLFPYERQNSETKEDSEEERRLFYVAITRAKEKLFLTFADYRTIFGSRQINSSSEFISDIPVDILEKEGERGIIKTIYLD